MSPPIQPLTGGDFSTENLDLLKPKYLKKKKNYLKKMAKKKKKKKPVNGWVGAHRTRVQNFRFSSPKKRATTLNA